MDSGEVFTSGASGGVTESGGGVMIDDSQAIVETISNDEDTETAGENLFGGNGFEVTDTNETAGTIDLTGTNTGETVGDVPDLTPPNNSTAAQTNTIGVGADCFICKIFPFVLILTIVLIVIIVVNSKK